MPMRNAAVQISPANRRRINRLGFAFVLLGAMLTLCAALFPQRWYFGPVMIGLRSVRNPLAILVLGYIMWRTTYDDFGRWLKDLTGPVEIYGDRLGTWLLRLGQRFLATWRRWGWRERVMFAAVACQTFFTLHFWQDYPAYLENERRAIANSYRSATYELNHRKLPAIEAFSRRLCVDLPPDARILFHGQTAGLRMAYEVYPRPVFMLPQEMRMLAASWHVQPQLSELPEDRKPDYWNERLPNETVEERQFIADHRINYVVTFDEYDLNKCRVERVQ